ncbi:MAG: SDR family NAD(P)-dependent oxidoreductase [Candidatus Latescibacteria bacterium]|jgi:NAD(P)-dependent dehydrogenase (short-subunit alcohol dehydrogenase family)|nr:short-chain dehydrogenase [Gemmatimonadaceae bacterium]MDP6019265.1 SDR family NAD(P)-dependent oxidoreductase [Candidatus Latescibacterota bacterium]MDP7448824.1 SDR family NAD(P)-dependent oxidoreductase [Candidatus Latescibacterota bacterium]HJP31307.1 SDR family NAD(P)-dependent oxidoreductase [Candidatus Latescibacterota bacterium]
MKVDLSDRVALVTGAAKGIGRAIADLLGANGAHVVYTDVDEVGLATVAEADTRRLDVTDIDSAQQVVDAILADHGHIDILVNNAGVNTADHRVPVDEFPKAEWDRLLSVDLDGPYHVSKAVIPSMRAREYGRIINIASIAGLVPLRLQSAFVAAKAGVVNLTKSMAIELGSAGILVNAVAPGSTLTDGTRQLFYGEDGSFRDSMQEMLDHIPLGRPGDVDEIAHAVLFLAAPESSYVNGHVLVVDGGWTAGYVRNF